MNKFYLQYDELTGEIKRVSPVLDTMTEFSHHEITESIAAQFFNSELSPDDWFVVPNSQNETELVKNTLDVVPEDHGKFISLTGSNSPNLIKRSIGVTIYSGSNTFEVMIPREFVNKPLVNITDETMMFRLTKKNDPSYVIEEFVIDINELIQKGHWRAGFKTKVKGFSVYTNKVFRNYNLAFSNSAWINTQNRIGRINKLVAFQPILDPKLAINGIIAIHNINNRTLELQVINSNDPIFSPGSTKSFLFLTKPDDPTVLISTVNFDFDQFLEFKTVTIKLKDGVGNDFGISGFPISDSMTFFRKQQ